jgi:hypothetical protein
MAANLAATEYGSRRSRNVQSTGLRNVAAPSGGRDFVPLAGQLP